MHIWCLMKRLVVMPTNCLMKRESSIAATNYTYKEMHVESSNHLQLNNSCGVAENVSKNRVGQSGEVHYLF